MSSGQLATIIYTSGTTGEPKGVMLNHSNLSSNAFDGLEGYEFHRDDLALSFLPLAHVYERTMDYGFLFRGVSVAYLEKMETVAEALLEVHPTMTARRAALLRKDVREHSRERASRDGLEARDFRLGAARGRESRAVARLRQGSAVRREASNGSIADKLVYSKIREGVGGRIRNFVSGGAPLAPELAEFFWSVGLPVYQGYGLTETSPIVTANLPPANKVGTVGRPIPHVQVRIADDGEILVKGPCVMQGYYHKPEETRQVLTPDGWFCTGDIGKARCGRLPGHHRPQERAAEDGGREVRGAGADRESAEDEPVHRECDGGGRPAQICFGADRPGFCRRSKRRRGRRAASLRRPRRLLPIRGCGSCSRAKSSG